MHHSQLFRQIKQCIHQFPVDVVQGKKLHSLVIKSGLHLQGPLYSNTLIDMYSKCRNLKDAAKMFDEMPERDLASWASIFTAYNLANLPGQTLSLFSTMLSVDGFQPDHFIFASLIKACARAGAWKIGLQLHAQFVLSKFSNDDVVKTSLVDFYAKYGLPDDAHHVFSSIESKNVVSWTSLVYGYARAGRKTEAIELLHIMPSKNVQSWTALISGFIQSGHFAESFVLFNELRREGIDIVEPFVLSSLIVGSASLAMLELGKQAHRLVVGLGYQNNLYISNTLIDMYAKCSDIFSAENIFSHMRDRDIVSWTSMIVGMAQHGRGDYALTLYDQMTVAGLKPNEVTFTGLIYACSHVGLVEKGRELFESMVADYGLRPSLQHYTCLLDLYSRSGQLDEAENILNSMPFKPDEAIWATLLSACTKSGKYKMGVRIANHLLEVGLEDPSTCILMSNIYARACMWESVSTVRKLMLAMELKKKPGYSQVNLGKDTQVFYAGETTHPMKDEIYSLLKDFDIEMKKRGYVPDTSFVLHDMDQQEKERQLFWHSERVAVAYGLLKYAPETSIRILKNLRVCGDCHTVLKLISSIVNREIIVRDSSRFHHFKEGLCSCRDFW